MNLILTFLLSFLLSTACFAQSILLGATAKNVFPVINHQGQVIQWNVSTFSGGLQPFGSYTGNPCGGFSHCYGFNGTLWQFNFTGNANCLRGCSYDATGPIVLNSPLLLPDGSSTVGVSAILHGTFTDQAGVAHPDVLGYFHSFTSPAKDGVTMMANGGLTLVLQDN